MTANNPNGSDFWAMTAYFNPIGYRRRFANYKRFRQGLNVPLVTVELSYDDKWELGPDDAEILVQLRGRDVMWQKERLLNIAVGHLPPDCRKVAWLDCDIVFQRNDWGACASELLDRFPLVQLFRRVHELCLDADADNLDSDRVLLSTPSLAWSLCAGPATPKDMTVASRLEGIKGRPPSSGIGTNGLAWAIRREIIDECTLYDAAIVGGADRLMACAALGVMDLAIDIRRMNSTQADHYAQWADPFLKNIRGQVSYLEGDIFHLWHGPLENRQYQERHGALERFEFDPFKDIALGDNGCWCWNSDKQELHSYVRRYLELRREDD